MPDANVTQVAMIEAYLQQRLPRLPRVSPVGGESHAPPDLCRAGTLVWQALRLVSAMAAGPTLRSMERDAIIAALAQTGGVQRKAAQLIGISPRMMCYKIHRLGIDRRGHGRP